MARTDYRQGSYKFIPFDCQTASDDHNKAVALFEYPNVDFPDAEDMGTPQDVKLKIYFLRDKYADWAKFLAKWRETGTGELVHPWEGAMLVQPMTLSVVRDNRID